MDDPYYGPPLTQQWQQPQPQWQQPPAGPTWVDIEVERIRAIARQVYRTKALPRLVVSYIVVVTMAVALDAALGPTRDDTSTTHTLIETTIGVLVLGVFVAAVVVGIAQRGKRRISPVWGLPLPARKQVFADVRTGRPAGDPVLRAIEQETVDAFRRSALLCYCLQSVLVLWLAFRGADSIRLGGWSGLVYLLYAAGFCYLLIANVRIGLGSRGFPRS